jgi:hypothetical protein
MLLHMQPLDEESRDSCNLYSNSDTNEFTFKYAATYCTFVCTRAARWRMARRARAAARRGAGAHTAARRDVEVARRGVSSVAWRGGATGQQAGGARAAVRTAGGVAQQAARRLWERENVVGERGAEMRAVGEREEHRKKWSEVQILSERIRCP